MLKLQKSEPPGTPFGAFEAGLLVVAAVGLVITNFLGSGPSFQRFFGESFERASPTVLRYAELLNLAWWVGGCVAGYALLPMLYLKVCGRRIRDFYLSPLGFIRHIGIYLLLVTPILLVVWGVSYLEDFQRIYPFYVFSGRSFFDLILWELLYGLQFFALEFFFRGFFLHGLRACLGYGAIFVMLVPYCMVHFLKTAAESLGSLIAGIVLGTLSMKYRSIWGGVLAHWLVAIAMDIASMLQKGDWPTRFWPGP